MILITELILILCVGVMIGLIVIVINNQAIGRALVKANGEQNQHILNNQQIVIANLKWANAMIHARCASGTTPLGQPLPYDHR